jgi:hypothetical protein
VERRFDLELDFLHRSLGIVARDGAQPVEPG